MFAVRTETFLQASAFVVSAVAEEEAESAEEGASPGEGNQTSEGNLPRPFVRLPCSRRTSSDAAAMSSSESMRGAAVRGAMDSPGVGQSPSEQPSARKSAGTLSGMQSQNDAAARESSGEGTGLHAVEVVWAALQIVEDVPADVSRTGILHSGRGSGAREQQVGAHLVVNQLQAFSDACHSEAGAAVTGARDCLGVGQKPGEQAAAGHLAGTLSGMYSEN